MPMLLGVLIAAGALVGFILGGNDKAARWSRSDLRSRGFFALIGAGVVVLGAAFTPSSEPPEWDEPVAAVTTPADYAAWAEGLGDEAGLLAFYADWCGPCRATAPHLNELAEEGVPVAVADVDASPELAAQFYADRIPLIVRIQDRAESARAFGYTSADDLRRLAGGA